MKACRMLAALACGLVACGLATATAVAAQGEFLGRLQVPEKADAFQQPLAVHADLHTGETFVSDRRTSRIVIFDDEGLYDYQIRGGQNFIAPLDLAVHPDGRILALAFIGARRTLVRLDFDGEWLGEIALSGLPEEAGEPSIVSVALSGSGERLYLLDQENITLWVADSDGRITGSAYLAEGMDAEAANEQILGHVDVYGETVLVALSMEGSVRLFDLEGTQVGRVGIKGGAPCQTSFPVAAALDRDGNVLVLDRQRGTVQVWRRGDNRCLSEILGYGGRLGRLYSPSDLAMDGAGRMTIGQGFDGRVQLFEHGTGAASHPSR
jgi:hypothetical protein